VVRVRGDSSTCGTLDEIRTEYAYWGQESTTENADSDSGEKTRKLGDLDPIDDSDHPQNNPEIANLTDDELTGALTNPTNGDKVTVKGDKVFDGNTRVNEAKSREFDPGMNIPVDELPKDNLDD
jgi:hypothetical protein